MKRDHLLNCLFGSILALVAGFSCAMCVASGFALSVDWKHILLWCVLAAGVCGVSLYFKRGWPVLLAAAALGLWLAWGELPDSFGGLAYEITRRFDSAYGVGVVGNPYVPDAALAAIGCVVTLTVGWTVCGCTPVTPAVLVCLTPFFLCVVVTDTVPENIWLGGLLFAVLELILTAPLRLKHRGQGVSLAAYLAIPLILGLVLLFSLVPRTGYDHQPVRLRAWLAAAAEDFPGAVRDLAAGVVHRVNGTAREETVDLASAGPLHLPTTPVADVVMPRSGVIYLREQDYDYYTGTGWAASQDRQEDVDLAPGIAWEETGTVTVSTRRSRELLFLPYYCTIDGVLENGAVENTDGLSAYTITQYVLPDGWKVMATARTYPPPEVDSQTSGNGDRYLQLPEGSRAGLEELVGEILSDEQSATSIANAIAAYVKDSAYYSLDTAEMPEGEEDFALWFLADSETGYCVHFATATTVLLRAAGVESRYVTGYSAYAIAGQVTTVTAQQAHAWVEYYEPRLGIWIPLEPTPPDLGDPAQTDSATEPSADALTTAPATHPDTPETTQPTGEKPSDTPKAVGRSALWLLWLIPGLILAAAVLRRRIILRGRRQADDPNGRVLELWQDVCRVDTALGRETPESLKALAEKACYSQHTLTQQEVEIFAEYLLDARAVCCGNPWYCRFLWRYWDVLF